ncbi:MAG: 23S rRNA (guanosine(2251)-2'-O)-methyltransferase RlmB [Bacillota bacterium]
MKDQERHFKGENFADRFAEADGGSRDQRDKQEALIAGRHAVIEALRYSKPLEVFLVEGLKKALVNEITHLARRRKVPLKCLSKEDFNRLAGDISGNQGVAATAAPFRYSSLSRLIAWARSSGPEPFLIMLDHIEDPQNLGAVMRTADAAGVHGLIIPDQRAAGVTAAVRKVAAGAAERLPVALVGNLNRASEMLKNEGFWLYGAEADGSEEYFRADYCRPLVLVIGSEGKGLSRLLRKNCDLTLNIPMPGSAGSLNIAAATAILTYAALAQREGWTG